MSARQQHPVAFLTAYALLLVLICSTLGATQYWPLPQHNAEVWIIPMPLGHELDGQHNRSGSWRVLWQTPGWMRSESKQLRTPWWRTSMRSPTTYRKRFAKCWPASRWMKGCWSWSAGR
jgi:hypothetical protein